jgi:hypothetical protein
LGGNQNGAIRRAIVHYKVDTHGASVTYDESFNDDGITDDSRHIRIGPSALRSPGYLGATIFHESVHVEQHLEDRAYEPE